jgi:hypothetical protein
MPLTVTLHVFSGRADPQWTISDDQASELRQLIEREGRPSIPSAREGMLGYRGFSVVEATGGEEPQALFRALAADGTRETSPMAVGIPEVEDFLLWTGHDDITDEVRAHVAQEIQRTDLALRSPVGEEARRCPPCHAVDAPTYNPGFWNVPARQPFNNCYNYANNQATNTFAQPGRATGHMYTTPPACTYPSPAIGVRAAAQSDGLVPCPNFSAHLPAHHGWYVALVIWPGVDYHWYRQDNVGCWSHKPGSTPARNWDNSNKPIVDPRTCNRGSYTVFCTFMITKRTVHIS